MRVHSLVLALLLSSACRSAGPLSSPIQSVRVEPFQCGDAVTAEAVRNVIIGRLLRESNAEIVRHGPADVVIEGTITTSVGAASTGMAAGSGQLFGGGFKGSGGEYVSGVTALALRDGRIITTASWGQNLSGRGILPPEVVADEAADRLVSALRRMGLDR